MHTEHMHTHAAAECELRVTPLTSQLVTLSYALEWSGEQCVMEGDNYVDDAIVVCRQLGFDPCRR